MKTRKGKKSLLARIAGNSHYKPFYDSMYTIHSKVLNAQSKKKEKALEAKANHTSITGSSVVRQKHGIYALLRHHHRTSLGI